MNPFAPSAWDSRSAGIVAAAWAGGVRVVSLTLGSLSMASLEHVLVFARSPPVPIGISDEHAELSATVRKWAESQGAVQAVRAAEDDRSSLASWGARAAELGLATIALPGDAGGGDGSLLDQAVALEAAAYALVPGPLLSTTVAGILHVDDELRRGIAAGEITVALAPRGGLDTAGDRLDGTVNAVLDAPSTSHVSLPVGDEGRHV